MGPHVHTKASQNKPWRGSPPQYGRMEIRFWVFISAAICSSRKTGVHEKPRSDGMLPWYTVARLCGSFRGNAPRFSNYWIWGCWGVSYLNGRLFLIRAFRSLEWKCRLFRENVPENVHYLGSMKKFCKELIKFDRQSCWKFGINYWKISVLLLQN